MIQASPCCESCTELLLGSLSSHLEVGNLGKSLSLPRVRADRDRLFGFWDLRIGRKEREVENGKEKESLFFLSSLLTSIMPEVPSLKEYIPLDEMLSFYVILSSRSMK